MDFKDAVNERRAVNFFDRHEPVPDERLREMVELAARAPSGFNLHPPRWRKRYEEIVVQF